MKRTVSILAAVFIIINCANLCFANEKLKKMSVTDPAFEEAALEVSKSVYYISDKIPDNHAVLKNHLLDGMFKYLSSSSMAMLYSDNNGECIKYLSDSRDSLNEINVILKLYKLINVQDEKSITPIINKIDSSLRMYKSVILNMKQ